MTTIYDMISAITCGDTNEKIRVIKQFGKPRQVHWIIGCDLVGHIIPVIKAALQNKSIEVREAALTTILKYVSELEKKDLPLFETAVKTNSNGGYDQEKSSIILTAIKKRTTELFKEAEECIAKICNEMDSAIASKPVDSLLGILHARIVSFAYVGADDPRIIERIKNAIERIGELSEQGVDISSCFVHLVALAHDNKREISTSAIRTLQAYADRASGQDKNLQTLDRIIYEAKEDDADFTKDMKKVVRVITKKLGNSIKMNGTLSTGTVRPPKQVLNPPPKPNSIMRRT